MDFSTFVSRRMMLKLCAATALLAVPSGRASAADRLTDRFGIFYFFSQTCGVCQQQSPVLRDFADREAITVVAISEDGGPSPEFPHYRVDAGERARMGLPGAATPTIALFDTRTHRVFEISEGFISASELAARISAMAHSLQSGGM